MVSSIILRVLLALTFTSIENESVSAGDNSDEEVYHYSRYKNRFCTCGSGGDCYEWNGWRMVYLGCCSCRSTFGRDDDGQVRHYAKGGCPYAQGKCPFDKGIPTACTAANQSCQEIQWLPWRRVIVEYFQRVPFCPTLQSRRQWQYEMMCIKMLYR